MAVGIIVIIAGVVVGLAILGITLARTPYQHPRRQTAADGGVGYLGDTGSGSADCGTGSGSDGGCSGGDGGGGGGGGD